MLRYEKLTVKAQEALQAAQEIAGKNGQQQLEPLHILAALVAQQDGVVPPMLSRLGVRPEALSAEIQTQIARLPKVSGVSQQYLSEASNQVLEKAFEEAEEFKDEYVSAEHILLAIAARETDPAAHLLSRHGASREAILQALTSVRGSHRVTSPEPGINLSRARAVRARPHGAGPPRQARSGDRPRRGNPPRHADPGPAHQE